MKTREFIQTPPSASLVGNSNLHLMLEKQVLRLIGQGVPPDIAIAVTSGVAFTLYLIVEQGVPEDLAELYHTKEAEDEETN